MLPNDRNTPDEDPPNQTPLANVSTQSPTTRKTVLPGAKSGSSSGCPKTYSMTPPSDVPPRPSTAPPHPSSDTTKGKKPQTDLQTRTRLVSNLRARNLLLQKAISHIDDAVLHLMAARSGIPSSKIQQVRGEARNRKDLLDRVDRAIKMAQNGELHEESQGEDASGGVGSGAGGERYATTPSLGQRKTMFNRFMKGLPRSLGPLRPVRFLEQRRLPPKALLPLTRLNSADRPLNPSWVPPRGNHRSPRRSTRSPNLLNGEKSFRSRSSPGKSSLQNCAPLNRTSRPKRGLLPAWLMRCQLRQPLHLRPKLKNLRGQSNTKERSLR